LRGNDVKDGKEFDCGFGIVVESGTNSLDITEHSHNVSESKKKKLIKMF
jgi:hypothetical protein